MANNVSFLQHQIGKFGVVTVMDAVFFEYGTVKPVLTLDTLKLSNITFDGETKEVRGGSAADLLMTYNHSRSVELEIEDALVSMYSLATLWGTNVNSLDGQYYKTKEEMTCTTDGTDPFMNPTKIFYNIKDSSADAVLGTDYFVTDGDGKDVATAADYKKGTKYIGYGYAKATASTTAGTVNPVEVVLKGENFPSALTLVGKVIFIDEETGKKVVGEIEVPKFQLGNSFEFSMDAEGDASTFNFNGMALADGTDKELIKIRTLALEDNVTAGEDAKWKI